jgi:hypothetical protein
MCVLRYTVWLIWCCSPSRYKDLLQQITSNFDHFEDNSSGGLWGINKAASRKDKDNQFIGYTFKRKKDITRTAMSEEMFGFNALGVAVTEAGVMGGSLPAGGGSDVSAAVEIVSCGACSSSSGAVVSAVDKTDQP